ncbi:cation:proton antiporter [Pilimelia columellifera]
MLGRLARRVGISPVSLYLLAGLAFGQGGIHPLAASEGFIEIGAEIGVVLLLVMLGLEYSADELIGNLRAAAPAGLIDAVLNAAPGAVFGLVMGWGPVAVIALAGVTWVTSSGVVAKVLGDLGRVGNRETPVILSILVIEDLAMAFYLPVLSALLLGLGVVKGAISLGIAVAAVLLVLVIAIRYGRAISKMISPDDPEVLLLGVLGLSLLIAGVAQQLQVSAAVGAFLVGIALSGKVAHSATQILAPLRDLFAVVFFVFFGLKANPADMPAVLLPALILAVVSMATKVVTGMLAARRAGIARPGQWRTGLALMPRGEFSIVIAALATAAHPNLAPLATAYVLITVVTAPLLSRIPDTRWFKRRMAAHRTRPSLPTPEPTPTPEPSGGRPKPTA